MIPVPPGAPTVLRAVSQHRRLVLWVLGIATGIAMLYLVSRPHLYTATADLVLDPASINPASSGPPERFVTDQAAVLGSRAVAEKASSLAAARKPPLGLTTGDFLGNTAIRASERDSNRISVSLSAPSATQAIAGVNTLIAAFEEVQRSQAAELSARLLDDLDSELAAIDNDLAGVNDQLQSSPDDTALQSRQQTLSSRRAALAARRDDLLVSSARGGSGVTLYLRPDTAEASSSLSALPVAGAILAGGAVLAVSAAYALASRRRVFSIAQEAEVLLECPLLIEVPRLPSDDCVPVLRDAAAAGDAFRFAATIIEARRPVGELSSIAVVSASRGDGRSLVSANLSLALAGCGLRTLLVDADLSTRGVTQLLLRESSTRSQMPGDETALLAGHLQRLTVPVGDGLELALLTPGREARSAAEFLATAASRDGLKQLFADFSSLYDMVVIDGPPLPDTAYASMFMSYAGNALVVVGHHAPVSDGEEVMRRLTLIGVRPLGYVYNHVPRTGGRTAGDRALPMLAPSGHVETPMASARSTPPPG
jgi:Mrp family chromosome partitioning ATPase